jgi:nitroimidazol reductase NimA-like FMN-containing flavoprotein (pyridoxamine 5'-phosphate oxidase superfamily)
MLRKEEAKRKAFEFLRSQRMAAVATATNSGTPQASALYYAIDDDFTFYFLTTQQSKKIANLRENKRIAFTVWQENQSIIIQGGGEAELLENGREELIFQEFDKNFKSEKPFHWPIYKLPNTGYIGIKVEPKWLALLNLNTDDPETYNENYYELIP